MEVSLVLCVPLSRKEVLHNQLSDFIVFIVGVHTFLYIHMYIYICCSQIQYTYKFLSNVIFMVNWSSAKFSSWKYHWQDFNWLLLIGEWDTHEHLHLTLVRNDGKFSALPLTATEVVTEVVTILLRLTTLTNPFSIRCRLLD